MSIRTDHVRVTTMKKLDHGQLHPKLEVPRLTCPGQEWNPGLRDGRRALLKEQFAQLGNGFSEDIHMGARPVENARNTAPPPPREGGGRVHEHT